MTNSDSKLSLKLLIDTKARKFLFAEAEKDCVDFLFHILTLTKLLKEKGMSGSLINLYESVENLKDSYVQSNQCKDILLKPKSSVGTISSVPFLLLNDVPSKRNFYGCSYSLHHAKVSDDPSAVCPDCGRCTMTRRLTYVAPRGVKEAATATGGFVKEMVTYIVMDDLVVKPMSAISSIALLNKFNVKDVGVLEEKVVNLGMEEALMLLKASFESKTVLKSVYMSTVPTSASMSRVKQRISYNT
ncbi:PREDICTED: uncharacterized protein LOC109226338 [Nicotiana attenuata]|uniref:DUF674 domain-containing protein n=1 Tax=Nicotiana attenuata TaxID=49451 RepID=A0A1J6IGH7_NICAT|nr:PREDICTED: uncharacterized protein LOC109226338 [Nicotiana attenuata]OIT03492.1 hypothetical protein A4A49_00976 [Nicotiana attenuata]